MILLDGLNVNLVLDRIQTLYLAYGDKNLNTYNPDTQLIKELALINCRELGGMPLEGGRTFRNGIFLRSGSPEWLNRDEIRKVMDYGVKTVIDLRGDAEVTQSPNPFATESGIIYHNIPLLNGDPNNTRDETMEYIRTHTLGDYYIIIAEEMGDRLVKIMRILLNSEGFVLFHCQHGKDRTGVTAALLYLICGASRENIITNYKVSYEYIKDFLAPLINRVPEDIRHAFRSDASNMVKFLDYLDSKWSGSAEKLLTANGLSTDEIKALKKKCIVC